jgi:hypothetical protein
MHPNAVAIRLRLALLVIESGAKQIPWQKSTITPEDGQPTLGKEMDFVIEDMTNYIAKYDHTSELCRLTPDEEYQLLLWMKGPFSTRLKYVETLRLVTDDPPGSTRHMLIPPETRTVGGLEVFGELYHQAGGMQARSHMTVMDFTYARPKPAKSCVKAVDLVMRWFDDELNGTPLTLFRDFFEIIFKKYSELFLIRWR